MMVCGGRVVGGNADENLEMVKITWVPPVVVLSF